MARNIKDMLAQKLAENSKRYSEAQQEPFFEAGRQHVKLPLDRIDPNPYQPRRTFPQAEIESLATSISETGLLQPISVRPAGERYQIIAGERRWRAHKLLGRASVEALVVPVEDGDMAVLALAENIRREDLSDYEIGKALRQVENLFPSKKKLAESLGMNREDMYRYFAFEALPPAVLARLEENPRLLSRSAASDLKRLLQRAGGDQCGPALMAAWARLEAGQLQQTKLAAHVAREARPRAAAPGGEEQRPAARALVGGNRVVGSVSAESGALVVKLKADALNDGQWERLIRFIEELAAEM
jgi:ParB family chromosome partitioning protein